MSIEKQYQWNILDYNISHKRLLLRSTTLKNGSHVNNDIIFEKVEYMALASRMDGLTVEEISSQSLDNELRAVASMHLDSYLKVFKLEFSKGKGIVIAAAVHYSKFQGPPLISSL